MGPPSQPPPPPQVTIQQEQVVIQQAPAQPAKPSRLGGGLGQVVGV